MKNLTINVTLDSHTLIGSGEGFGAVIDSDIVFDHVGIPVIPARRIKGCLRDSAFDVFKMFEQAKVEFPKDIRYNDDNSSETDELHPIHQTLFDNTFGKSGEEFDPAGQSFCGTLFTNLAISDYEANKAWLHYVSQAYHEIVSLEAIIHTFTMLRQQTAINERGVAGEHSLRTIRVIKKGYTFSGSLEVNSDDPDILTILAFACRNLQHIGTKRNRGFGEVICALFDIDNQIEISVQEQLEALCNG